MAKKEKHKSKQPDKPRRHRAAGKTVESRENQLIGLSIELAARQLRQGTASSQVITHFLKLGSTQMQLEKVKIQQENKLLEAKAEALKSQKKVEDLYAHALEAMRSYNGQEPVGNDED